VVGEDGGSNPASYPIAVRALVRQANGRELALFFGMTQAGAAMRPIHLEGLRPCLRREVLPGPRVKALPHGVERFRWLVLRVERQRALWWPRLLGLVWATPTPEPRMRVRHSPCNHDSERRLLHHQVHVIMIGFSNRQVV
jgi:hypothetical protein